MGIKPTYATFEQAKLLKEKRFDVECHHGYFKHGDTQLLLWLDSEPINSELAKAPEQWQVVEWLRIKHGIWILVLPTVCGYYAYKIVDVQLDPANPIERPPYSNVNGVDYNTPQEAYSAAFDYILKNLI
jgi:hypothetical protein